MQADENRLIERVRRGELAAATELVDRFYEAIYAYLRRLTGNDADAADLTQRTFARVWPAMDRFAGRSLLRSWLHGIAHHVWQDWRRSNHRLEARPDAWWEACRDDRPGPDERAAAADLACALYAAVDQLDPAVRETVHLHYYQGLTLEETADVLGVASSTVKYRVRNALVELKASVAAEPKPPQTLIPSRTP